jgi:hypothetical protein
MNWIEKEQAQMVNNYMKCSIYLVVKEVCLKVTLWLHLTSIRVAIIKKTKNNNAGKDEMGKGTLLHHGWEYKLVQSLWKSA